MSFSRYQKEIKKKREEARTISLLKNAVANWTKRKDEYTANAKDALKKGNESQARMQIALLRNAMVGLAQAQDMHANYIAARDMREMQKLSAHFVRSLNSVMKDVARLSKSVNFEYSQKLFKKSVSAQGNAAFALRELLEQNGQAFSDNVSLLAETDENDIRTALLREIGRETDSLDSSLTAMEAEFAAPVTEKVTDAPKKLAEAESDVSQPLPEETISQKEPSLVERIPDKKRSDSPEEVDFASYFGYHGGEYIFPPIDLLKDYDNAQVQEQNESAMHGVIEALEGKLSEFGIKAVTERYIIGPVFTRIELRPDASTQIARIGALKDDISMALQRRVRLLLPIEGKSLIGVEVGNEVRAVVPLKRMVMAQREKENDAQNIEAGLGVDLEYQPQFRTFFSLPHLLVGGTTGSGKSVFLNSLIMQILYRYAPSDVRLVLIDFKRVEFGIYNSLPHVVGGRAIDEYEEAMRVVELLKREMERRYSLFSEAGVRNLAEYNSSREKKIPHILLIIDEYADIACSAYAKQFDRLIQRLAQKARACGIHLVISTQRPSVKVINGVIKANFPTRVAFAVASHVDSMNILDSTGAECLLGSGDMLFASGRHTDRLQSPYVSTDEILAVTDFIKRENK